MSRAVLKPLPPRPESPPAEYVVKQVALGKLTTIRDIYAAFQTTIHDRLRETYDLYQLSDADWQQYCTALRLQPNQSMVLPLSAKRVWVAAASHSMDVGGLQVTLVIASQRTCPLNSSATSLNPAHLIVNAATTSLSLLFQVCEQVYPSRKEAWDDPAHIRFEPHPSLDLDGRMWHDPLQCTLNELSRQCRVLAVPIRSGEPRAPLAEMVRIYLRSVFSHPIEPGQLVSNHVQVGHVFHLSTEEEDEQELAAERTQLTSDVQRVVVNIPLVTSASATPASDSTSTTKKTPSLPAVRILSNAFGASARTKVEPSLNIHQIHTVAAWCRNAFAHVFTVTVLTEDLDLIATPLVHVATDQELLLNSLEQNRLIRLASGLSLVEQARATADQVPLDDTDEPVSSSSFLQECFAERVFVQDLAMARQIRVLHPLNFRILLDLAFRKSDPTAVYVQDVNLLWDDVEPSVDELVELRANLRATIRKLVQQERALLGNA